jgi:hypothetical protein
MKPFCLGIVAAIALSACAKSATMPLSVDTFQLTTSAAPVCGRTGAQNVAVRRAAIETINRGYDKFLILGAAAQNNVRVVGHTPVQAHTVGTATATGYGNLVTAQGSSTTTYTGGYPIVAGTHDQGLIVKMFKEGDPAGARAIGARATLGPSWKEAVKENAATTC